jgi:hypothetical protein
MGMAKRFDRAINKFYGGIARDDKSKVAGAASNIEELDIFSNENFIQAEQIFTADALPTGTYCYAKTVADDDKVWGYGEESSTHKVRLVSVASGGADNPGAIETAVTCPDTVNLATKVSDFKFFRTAEATNNKSLYYIKGASTSWYVARYNIGAAEEQRWTGSAWSASGSWDSNSQLTGLTGSFMRPTMKVIFGELLICHNQYIARVDKSGVFTEKAFTLPSDWQAVDIVDVGDSVIILARNIVRMKNETRGFWWNLTNSTQFDDQFTIPMGGPLWIVNRKEAVIIACAINGVAKFFKLSVPSKGAIPNEIPGILLTNVATDADLQPISSPKMVGVKDKFLYFALNKTDKTGVYMLGQMDADKPEALLLTKRLHTSDYSKHVAVSFLVHGPNFYADFVDNGTFSMARCESNNSPARSSNAVYESVWIDDDAPFQDKTLNNLLISTYPLAASTSIAASVAVDYGTYTAVKKPNGADHTGENAVLANFKTSTIGANKKVFRVKLAFTSSGTNSPKLTSIGLSGQKQNEYSDN